MDGAEYNGLVNPGYSHFYSHLFSLALSFLLLSHSLWTTSGRVKTGQNIGG